MNCLHLRITFILIAVLACMGQAHGEASRKTLYGKNSYSCVLVTESGCMGIETPDGEVLIPVEDEYESIELAGATAPAQYFLVSRSGSMGVYTLDGQLIIPTKYSSIEYNTSSGFRYYDADERAMTPLGIRLRADGSAEGEGLPARYKPKPVFASSSRPTQQTSGQPQQEYYIAHVTDDATDDATNDVPHRPSTEILSIHDNGDTAEAAESGNIYPVPLQQGAYDIFMVKEGDENSVRTDGMLIWNKPTRSIYIVIPKFKINVQFKSLNTRNEQTQDEQLSNSLMYVNSSDQQVEIQDIRSLDGFMLITTKINGTFYYISVNRSTYRYLSPSEVVQEVTSY